jgi:hypothetical protein
MIMTCGICNNKILSSRQQQYRGYDMVTNASEDNGLEELLQLSRKIGDMGKEFATDLGLSRKSIEQVEKKRALWSVIREYKISQVLEKLEPLVTFEIFNEVNSLKNKRSTINLRQMILKLIEELDKYVNEKDASQMDTAVIKQKLKTLYTLLELVFYID